MSNTKAPTMKEATASQREYVLKWLRDGRDLYDRQADRSRGEWVDASNACGDVMRDAITTLEAHWGKQ